MKIIIKIKIIGQKKVLPALMMEMMENFHSFHILIFATCTRFRFTPFKL